MTEYVRCKKCRSTLVSKEENKCLSNCHGLDEASADDTPCFIDKSIVYIRDEQMPNWLDTLVQNASLNFFHRISAV